MPTEFLEVTLNEYITPGVKITLVAKNVPVTF